jgi:DNA/RNA-binding domain of Phe-tRNA-synthetase-like protein
MSADSSELRAAPGFVEPAVHDEFPGLRLVWLTVEARPRRTAPAVALRLQALSNRYFGASVVAMRTQPIPHAYRVFYRQIGLDPDVTRVPSEQAAVARLLQGRFVSHDAITDAVLLALLETGVPVWALDADRVDAGGLGIRTTRSGEALGPAGERPAGRLVVADASRIHALLFGEVVPGHRPGPHTRRLALYAVGVEGVPAMHLEESLWVSLEALKEA